MARLDYIVISIVSVLADIISRGASAFIKIPDISQLNYTRAGDLMLGLVVSVHGPEIGTIRCAEGVRDLGQLQRLETIVFAIEEVNNSTTLLPNHTLGYSIFDDCYRDTIALAQTLHFSSLVSADDIDDDVTTCDIDDVMCPYPMRMIDVIGVIGGESSSSSVSMAQLLTTFQKPQLSYLATTPALSNKNRFPYFSRVVSSDVTQAQVIVQLLKRYNWTYVSVVYFEGSYGSGGLRALQEQVASQGICFTQVHEIREDFDQYRNLVFSLISEPRSRVAVTFVPDFVGRKLLEWAGRLFHQGKITWIAADAWLRDPDLISMRDDVTDHSVHAMGALSINIRASPVRRFDEYFRSLTRTSLPFNPWINKYLQQYHNCNNDTCAEGVRIADHPDYAPETTVSLVFDTVYSFAHALDKRTRECTAKHPGINSADFDECVRENLTSAIRDVRFRSEAGDVIQFDENGDRRSAYDIYNVQSDVNGTSRLVRVAEWDPDVAQLNFLGEEIHWPQGALPVSRCSERCEVGEARLLEDKRCCWSCVSCEPSQIVTENRFGVDQCVTCPNTSWPDPETRRACLPIIAEYVRWSDPMGIGLSALAGSGLIVCFLTVIAYVINNNHALIKASDRELSYTMMAGNVASFVFVFVFLAPPSWETCTTSLFGAGMSFTLIYAPLMLKLIRIWRIFHAGRKMTRSPMFVDSKSQMIACAVLIAVVGAIVIPWVYTHPGPMVEEVDADEPGSRERICSFPLGPFITAICVNVAFLVACAVFAFKNRTLPNNFNESKFAAFFVYSTCVLWLAFVPAYFLTRLAYRILFLCIMLIGNAVVCLCGMYVPKIYAVYFVKNNDLHIIGVRNMLLRSTSRPRAVTSQFLEEDDVDYTSVKIFGTEGEERKISTSSQVGPSSLKPTGTAGGKSPGVPERKVVINEGKHAKSNGGKAIKTGIKETETVGKAIAKVEDKKENATPEVTETIVEVLQKEEKINKSIKPIHETHKDTTVSATRQNSPSKTSKATPTIGGGNHKTIVTSRATPRDSPRKQSLTPETKQGHVTIGPRQKSTLSKTSSVRPAGNAEPAKVKGHDSSSQRGDSSVVVTSFKRGATSAAARRANVSSMTSKTPRPASTAAKR